jgi:TonB-linked SusC/RagA family outer membrane protein
MKRCFMFLLMSIVLSIDLAMAQTQVSGTVTSSEDGEPVVGASILVQGSKIGTVTDVNGKFSFSAPANSKLVISYIGMVTKTVKAGKNIHVVLDQDNNTLDDVMVVAYGTVKKSAFTGSASEVKAELLETPAASIDKGLAGQVAGLQVISASGQPGSATTFRVRGSGSLSASNEPLIVIDGVAITNKEYSEVAYENDNSSNVLAAINPNDIESVTVLKDAAAAAMYGSRAANGVIVITTKKGQAGKAKVTIDAKYTTSSVAGKYDMMSSGDYFRLLYNSYREQGNSVEDANTLAANTLTHNPYNVDYPYDADGNLVSGAKLVVDTDWQDEIFSPASTYDLNASVSGGTNSTNYFFSLGYLDQDGVSPNAHYTRYSGSMNISSEVNNWLNVGLNLKLSQGKQVTEVGGASGAGASPLVNAVQFPNAVPVYIVDSDGNPILDENGNKQYNFTNPTSRDFNPLAIPYMDHNNSKLTRFIGSAFAEIKIVKGLKFRTVIAPDFTYNNEHRYWNKEHGNGPAYNGRLDKFHTTDYTFTSTNTLNYNNIFAKKHSLNVLAGMEYWRSRFEYLYAGGRDILGNFEELSAASSSFSPNSYTNKEVMISYFGRAEYAYDDKYNLSASLRTDGSSVFGENKHWGTFWSVGGSWRIFKENFMKNLTWIDNLKLRVSYGTSGNKNGMEPYQSKGLFQLDADYKYGSDAGVVLYQLENLNLSWEKQRMFNVGVDFSFWNRFYGSIDYFYKVSDGLLYDYPLAIENGLTSVTLNAAKVSNSGWEFVLGCNILKDGPVKWNLELNASAIRDKIKDLNGDNDVDQSDYAKIWTVGESQYEFYMPTWAGVDPQNGDPLWYTVDSEGNRTTTNDYSEATWERQGKSAPDVYGGLHNTITYKNFELSAQINFTFGGKVYDGTYALMMNEGNSMGYNLNKDELNAWTTVGQVTDVPRYEVNNTNSSNSLSSRFLFDATNIKLQNVTLSYRLPKNLGFLSKYISGGRVYISGDNLLTWFSDDWKGYDDIDIFGVQGYANSLEIPTPRSFTFGLSLTF